MTATLLRPDALTQQGLFCRLDDFGLIAAAGEDAKTFLHGQLTCAVEDLNPGTARLAGYCSVKGRLLGTMLIWADDANGVVMMTRKELVAPLTKRLSMFVLRAKAKLRDAGGESALFGVAGAAIERLRPWWPQPPAVPMTVATVAAGALIRLPDAQGLPRWLWQAPADTAPTIAETLGAGDDPELWRWLELLAGTPWVTGETVEQFVPQMINFEAIGGVNFRKGCYPGQEIVARAQYRGTVKRRMQLATADCAPPAAATELFWPGEPGQPCGVVVNAARSPSGGCTLLAEIRLEAHAAGDVRIGSITGPALHWLTLPYSLDTQD